MTSTARFSPKVGLLVAAAALAVGAWIPVMGLRQARRELNLACRVNAGLPEAEAVRVCTILYGQPLGVVTTASQFEVAPFNSYEKPSGMLGLRAIVWRINDKLVYVFIGREATVSCVFWARSERTTHGAG